MLPIQRAKVQIPAFQNFSGIIFLILLRLIDTTAKKSRQYLDNVDKINLVLASGKLELQVRLITKLNIPTHSKNFYNIFIEIKRLRNVWILTRREPEVFDHVASEVTTVPESQRNHSSMLSICHSQIKIKSLSSRLILT